MVGQSNFLVMLQVVVLGKQWLLLVFLLLYGLLPTCGENIKIPRLRVVLGMSTIICGISLVAINNIYYLGYLGKNYILLFALAYILMISAFVFLIRKFLQEFFYFWFL